MGHSFATKNYQGEGFFSTLGEGELREGSRIFYVEFMIEKFHDTEIGNEFA